MALIRSTSYAPDIFRALNGILLVCKPARITSSQLELELRDHISDALNQFQPRPVTNRILIQGELDQEKTITQVPNLADHPLVAGPRYLPWELSLSTVKPSLSFRSTGLNVMLLGHANRMFSVRMKRARMVSVYHIAGKLGYATDTCLYDGKIIDKATIKHVSSGRMDAVLSKIESVQYERLFDSASVPLDSQKAYELAKAWPARPPKMAPWPVIYRIRCIHLKAPDFKIEVTICNENESFLARLCNDIGLMLKSSAYTESIRRVKFGPFDIKDSLTDKDWDIQTIVNHLNSHRTNYGKLIDLLNIHRKAMQIRPEHDVHDYPSRERQVI